jgi:hypothetical protein
MKNRMNISCLCDKGSEYSASAFYENLKYCDIKILTDYRFVSKVRIDANSKSWDNTVRKLASNYERP